MKTPEQIVSDAGKAFSKKDPFAGARLGPVALTAFRFAVEAVREDRAQRSEIIYIVFQVIAGIPTPVRLVRSFAAAKEYVGDSEHHYIHAYPLEDS